VVLNVRVAGSSGIGGTEVGHRLFSFLDPKKRSSLGLE
jgi:hypothetical protein